MNLADLTTVFFLLGVVGELLRQEAVMKRDAQLLVGELGEYALGRGLLLRKRRRHREVQRARECEGKLQRVHFGRPMASALTPHAPGLSVLETDFLADDEPVYIIPSLTADSLAFLQVLTRNNGR